jgi:hypothetical protein
MRPASSWSRLNELRSFLLQLGISIPSAHSRCVRRRPDVLVDTFQSDHALFELYEPPNNKQETLLNGTCERKRESGHGSIYAWREETSEGSETNHDCREDVESGYHRKLSYSQKIYGVPESHRFTVLSWSVMTSLDGDGTHQVQA